MENLESHLKSINREDILNNFKKLAYSSYGTRDRILVTEIRRPGDTIINGLITGDEHTVDDSERAVEEKRYSGDTEDPPQSSGVRIEINGSPAEKDDVIKGMFSDNQEILEFFKDGTANNGAEETEID